VCLTFTSAQCVDMLRLRCATAARKSCMRSFATDSPRLSDQLDHLLNTTEGHKLSPPWLNPSAAPEDNLLSHPPQAPPGSLPAGGASQMEPNSGRIKGKNELPQDRMYHLHVSSSRNNTILTFTDAIGNPRAWVSSGSCGFKKVQRSGYEAGYQCAVKMFEKIVEERKRNPGIMKLEILFKGFGFGREALYRALMTTEGEDVRGLVDRVTDTTPLKIGGTRAKKTRRL
jgi:small subunit ribosomal protein S11